MAQKQLKIFFDLDGTLIDVSKRHYKVYSEIVTEFGGRPLHKDRYWSLKRAKTGWPELLAQSGLKTDTQHDFLEAFIARIEDPAYLELDTLLPETEETLRAASRSHTCYLVSLRRNKQNLLDEVQRLGIGTYFAEILSAHSESDGSDKKTELMKHKLEPNETALVVGDTEADIKAGKTLGLTTVAVLSGIRSDAFLAKLAPDFIITGVEDLQAAGLLP